MHLLTFMTLRNPGWIFRTIVLGAQGSVLSPPVVPKPPDLHMLQLTSKLFSFFRVFYNLFFLTCTSPALLP